MSFNKITIVGNLGKDPELRYTPQGIAVCSFSVATNERRKDKAGELQDITTWFRITLWRQQAENAAKYLTKGSPVYIEGRLKIDEWTDKDGNNRYTLDVQASDMQFIGSRSSGGDEGGSAYGGAPDEHDFARPESSRATAAPSSGGASSGPPMGAADDDIPF
jgi:single-strand DNA-binding protein